MIEVKKVSKEEYIFETKDKSQSFLQKSYWGDVKALAGDYFIEYWLITTEKDLKTIGAYQSLCKTKTFLSFKKKFDYIPRTTFFFDPELLFNTKLTDKLFREIEKQSIFSIVEFETPYWHTKDLEAWNNKLSNLIEKYKLLTLQKNVQPKTSLLKDVTESEDLISTFISSNAARNTKRGIKKLDEAGIKFFAKNKLSDKELQEAYKLIIGISDKNDFLTRDLQYFKNTQEIVSSCIWFGFKDESNDKIVLANLGIIEESTSSYYDLYVGRDYSFDKFYISNVLKLKSFEYLKEHEIKYYENWGIDLDESSPKYKFTQFKMQFGGSIINFKTPVVITRFKSLVKLPLNLLKLRG